MKLYFILLSFLFVGVCHAQKVTRINSNKIAVEGDTIIYFDAEKRIMSEGEKNVSLTNQSAKLLELFMQADNHILSINAIGKALWKVDGNYDNRIYQVLNRLRGFLRHFLFLFIEIESVGSYQLKISEI